MEVCALIKDFEDFHDAQADPITDALGLPLTIGQVLHNKKVALGLQPGVFILRALLFSPYKILLQCLALCVLSLLYDWKAHTATT